MSKFKKGDRVRRTTFKHFGVPIGMTGTVAEHPTDFAPKVAWDNGVMNYSAMAYMEPETPSTMNTLNITKEKVLEAASKCSTAKATLQVLFPEAFEPEKPEPVRFEADHRLPYGTIAPLVIMSTGMFCPPGLGDKCLMVGTDYRMETQEYKGQTILTFYKK